MILTPFNMNPIQEYYSELKRFEALCTIRNQLPENVKNSRKLEAIATKHIFVGTKGMHCSYTVLMEVLGLDRTMQYRYKQNIKNGHFASEINKYKNISVER